MPVIIDGHNLIGKMPDIRLDEADDEQKLILKIRQYRARTGQKVIIVFDSGICFRLSGKQTKGGITVQYAPHNASADQVIVNYLHRARAPKQILVVTSDRAIQREANVVGTRVISAAEFAIQLNRPPAKPKDESSADDVQLSKAEVDEWLKIFGQDGETK